MIPDQPESVGGTRIGLTVRARAQRNQISLPSICVHGDLSGGECATLSARGGRGPLRRDSMFCGRRRIDPRKHKSIHETLDESLGTSSNESIDESLDASSDENIDASSDESSGASSGESIDASSDESSGASSGESISASSDESPGASSGKSIDASSDESLGAGSDESLGASGGESLEASSDESVGKRIRKRIAARRNGATAAETFRQPARAGQMERARGLGGR